MTTFAVPDLSARQSLRQQIGDVLRGALITGDMRAGPLYSAPDLAKRFGISVTPVREALIDLANEGLVDAVRNKGFRVIELTAEDLDHLTSLRALIEVPTVAAIATATPTAPRSQLESLRESARKIEQLADRGDLVGFVVADHRFHAELLALSGNRYLVDVVSNLRTRSRLYGLQALAERGELVSSAREHGQLVDLLLEGHGDEAAALMRTHIGHVRGAWA